MDSFDLFKKLTSGAKLRPTFKTPKPAKNVNEAKLIKQEPDENTAEQWLNAQTDDDDDLLDYTKEEEEWSGLDDDNDDHDDDNKPDIVDLPKDNKARKRKHEEITLLGSLTAVNGGEDEPITKKKKKKKKVNNDEEEEDNSAEKKKQAEIERVKAARKKLKVSVSGGGVPPPVENFEELKTKYRVSDILIKNLSEAKYTEPTPIQAQAWPIMLSKRQILACAPTGSGKTAAFLLPVLHFLKTPNNAGIRAVVVSPTRELARQTFRECQRLAEGTGLRPHIISKVGPVDSTKVSKANKKYDILITTPNRLVYMLNQEPPAVSLRSVQWLIIDESDKLFEAGPRGFRDQLATIYQSCDSQSVMRAMFSATHGAHVASWCKKHLKGLIAVTVGIRNTAAELVDQELIFVGNEQGKLLAMRELILKGITPPVLIFLQSKERAKELFQELLYDGINVDVIHADRTQLQRDNVVRSFREGKIWVLICTELMGRGIDFKGVNLVINYDFPQSAVSYIHRIGRTGRAGRKGKAVTFFTESDKPLLRSIAMVMRDSGCEVPQYMLEMKKISKKERRKLENHAPKRQHILTSLPKPEKEQDSRDLKKKTGKKNRDKSIKHDDDQENSNDKKKKFKKNSSLVNGDAQVEIKRKQFKEFKPEEKKYQLGKNKLKKKNKPLKKNNKEKTE